MNSWGFGASLKSRHWILCRAPYFRGQWENPQNFVEKFDQATLGVVITKQLNIGKWENKLANEGLFTVILMVRWQEGYLAHKTTRSSNTQRYSSGRDEGGSLRGTG